jgi:hypothetical protein
MQFNLKHDTELYTVNLSLEYSFGASPRPLDVGMHGWVAFGGDWTPQTIREDGCESPVLTSLHA